MSIPPRLSRYLETRGAKYEVYPHDPSRSSAETARAAHVKPHQLAKSVVLEDRAGCVMAVLPADKALEPDKVAELIGRRSLRLAPEDRLAALFPDCDRGAVPPVGMAWGVETVVDDDLEANDTVYMEAGDHELLLRMTHEQFHALMSAQRHGRFSKTPAH